MKNVTITEIKHFENSLELFNEIEIDLDSILLEEYKKELPNDVNSLV